MADFFVRALIGGIGVALVAGPLGCFVVWRRMAYFGASIAHSALLGVALGLLIGMDLNGAITIVCVAVALMLLLLQQQRQLATDTLLGIIAHGALALGLVVVSVMGSLRIDLMGYLFGDLLAVTMRDVAWIYGGGVAVIVTLAAIWRPMLSLTLHEELARAEGVRVALARTIFTLLIALTIAIAMKIVGLLLIISLLIIPPAAARRFARTPEQMAVLASVLGCASVVGGLYGSLAWDTPSGPSVVVAALVLFLISTGAAALLALIQSRGAAETG